MAFEKRIVTLIVLFSLILPLSTNLLFIMPPHSAAFAANPRGNSISGLLTGRIFDKGIDRDGNGLFDVLQVNVEVNITQAGMYNFNIYDLQDGSEWPYSYVDVYDYETFYLSEAIQNITMSFYGPTIQASGETGLSFVGTISVNSEYSYISDSKSSVPLSRSYSYLEFDSAFTNMEATFQVLPNGTVDMAGLMNSTHMPTSTNGMNIGASVNVSSSGGLTNVSTSGNFTLPSYVASQWPYNASTASLRTDYSKQTGDLNMGLNSTVVLQPGEYSSQIMSPYQEFYGSQYPWNSSNFNLNLACSNGVASGELQAQTTMPPDASLFYPSSMSFYPFNTTDFSLKANYLAGLLKGNITFHILSGFPLTDLNVDFQASRTQTTVSGSINVIYGTYDTTIVNEPYVDGEIANITVREGTGPDSLFNMTNGMVELDPTSSITKTPFANPPGTTVDFNLTLDGDPTTLIAFELSGSTQNIDYAGIFRLLNATITSVNNASIQMSYFRATQTATLDIIFNGDMNKLVSTLFAFPDGTWPLAVRSSSMTPTLEVGDIVLVKNITDTSEINAAPYPDGTIIAFTNPQDTNEIIIHRAISEILWNNTEYFQTQGDYNMGPDLWNGPNTYQGMISEKQVLGKIVERMPYIGSLYVALGNSYGITPNLSGQNITQLAKDLLSLAKTLNLQLNYTNNTSTINLKLSGTFDVGVYREKILPELPDIVMPPMKDFVAGLSSNIYANVTSEEHTLSYQNGEADGQATVTAEGDCTSEINYMKNLYVNLILNQTSQEYEEPWYVLNSTWLDASNLSATIKIVDDSALFSFNGFRASPPTDQIDASSFRLARFFNFTKSLDPYETEMPTDREKLTLKLQCLGNGTNILRMTAPSTMQPPDNMSEDQTFMMWNNQTISSLGDIVFSTQGYIQTPSKNPVIIGTNGTMSAGTFDPSQGKISLTIDGPHGSTGFANVSIPTSVLSGPIENWTIIVGNRTIRYPDYQITNTTDFTYLYFTFTFGSPVTIQIVVPEFPNFLLPLLIIGTTMIAVTCSAILRIRRKQSIRTSFNGT